MSQMYIVGGLDIGNGFVKGGLRTENGAVQNVDYPSSVARSSKDNFVPVTEQDAGGVIADIYNQMNISFDSPTVTSRYAYWFGRRANSSGKSVQEFSVQNTKSKTDDELSAILVLGSVAGRALQEYWNANQKLPVDVVPVSACVGLALPINEFSDNHMRYARMFMGNGTGDVTHMVCFQNFDRPVRVCITFENVRVMPEGASAQYAIASRGPAFMEMLLDNCRKHGAQAELEGVTGEDMLQLQNIVGIDIGEGTVNFPVFKNGSFNTDASRTLPEGYGNMLEDCIDPCDHAHLPHFNSRKQLADYILNNKDKGLPTKRQTYKQVMHIVEEQSMLFAENIIDKFDEVMRAIGADVDVVYVYGGGASHIKEFLYDLLMNRSRDYGGGELGYPVMYLSSSYSRYLNMEGLMLVANAAAQERHKATPVQAPANNNGQAPQGNGQKK